MLPLMLNQSPNHNIMLTPNLTPNRTLNVTPNGKVLKKAKKENSLGGDSNRKPMAY